MNKKQATHIICKIINSGILDLDLEDELQDICYRLENDEWDDDEDDEDD